MGSESNEEFARLEAELIQIRDRLPDGRDFGSRAEIEKLKRDMKRAQENIHEIKSQFRYSARYIVLTKTKGVTAFLGLIAILAAGYAGNSKGKFKGVGDRKVILS